MRHVLSRIHPGILGHKSVEFFWSYLLSILLEGLGFSVSLVGKSTGHDNEGLEALVDTAEKTTRCSIATVAGVGQALGINVLAGEKEIGAATKGYVLLHFHRDLLFV